MYVKLFKEHRGSGCRRHLLLVSIAAKFCYYCYVNGKPPTGTCSFLLNVDVFIH